MKYLTLAIAVALFCAVPVHAQETTVVVQDPDPPTPAVQQTTTTTTTEHYDTSSTTQHTRPAVHHPVQPHPAAHPATVATHHPVTSRESTDTETTTQTTVTIPPHNPTAEVRENPDGTITVSTSEPAVEVPADQDDGHH